MVCVRSKYEDKNKVEKYCFEDVWRWEGMKFRSAAHGGMEVTFETLMDKYYARNPNHTQLPKLKKD